MSSKAERTQTALRAAQGDEDAINHLIPVVYDDLRAIAKGMFQHERVGHVLQPTALVHAAYLKLVQGECPDWKTRSHLVAIIARVMRQVLVDEARVAGAKKRGAGWRCVTPADAVVESRRDPLFAIEFDDLISELSKVSERQAAVVVLRIHEGLTIKEVAHALDASERTVAEDWRKAQEWMLGHIGK